MEIFIFIVIAIVLIIIIRYKLDRDRDTVYGICAWCGKTIPLFRKTRRWYDKTNTPLYCSKKCEKADEDSSTGIRIKIVDE